jgi:hypothetical protein
MQCEECGRTLLKNETQCPYCGVTYGLSTAKQFILFVVGLVVLGLVAYYWVTN